MGDYQKNSTDFPNIEDNYWYYVETKEQLKLLENKFGFPKTEIYGNFPSLNTWIYVEYFPYDNYNDEYTIIYTLDYVKEKWENLLENLKNALDNQDN